MDEISLSQPGPPSREPQGGGNLPPSLVVVGTGVRSAEVSRAEFESMAVELVAPLTAAARALTRKEHDAEDVVQETLFRAWKSIGTFERGTNFRGWLFRILHNVFANRWNRAKRAPIATDPDTLDPPAAPEPFPDVRRMGDFGAISDRHLDEQVKAAFADLPPHYLEPFVMFSLGEMTYSEIADALDIPIGTVMSRLHRARGLLRERLASYAREQGFRTGDAS